MYRKNYLTKVYIPIRNAITISNIAASMAKREMQSNMEKNRLKARTILLNKNDIINFNSVPDFIIDCFFGESTYKSRLIVTTFGFVNGISPAQLLLLLRWKRFGLSGKRKIESLYEWLQNPNNGRHYYSYSVVRKLVIFCNGDVRKHGKRIV